MQTELREDLKFYLDRLHYYQALLKAPGSQCWPGYGSIKFEHRDRAAVEMTYEFWLDGLVKYIIKHRNSS